MFKNDRLEFHHSKILSNLFQQQPADHTHAPMIDLYGLANHIRFD